MVEKGFAMRRHLLLLLVIMLASGCAISGKGNWPHPVWLWECGPKPEDERCYTGRR